MLLTAAQIQPATSPSPLLALLLLHRLIKVIRDDATFLKNLGVMDYSLLLGVHFCK